MNYKSGIKALTSILKDKDLTDLLTLEVRLNEVVEREGITGPNDNLSSTKAQILHELNRISLQFTGISFNQLSETPEVSIVPVEKLLRSAIPNLGSTREKGREWVKQRLDEVSKSLQWIDRDCGFEAENYVGINLTVKSARMPSSFMISKVQEITATLGIEDVDNADRKYQEYRSNDIFDIFNKLSQPMVLLGDPGGGKSISIRHLGAEIAKHQQARDEKKHTIPLYIHLGDYTQKNAVGYPLSVEDFIVNYSIRVWDKPAEATLEKFRELAETGHFVFLFDSMDEMPRDDYLQRYDELRSIVRKYGKCRFVFACRKADYDQRLNVTEVVLDPMGQKQIRAYLSSFLIRSCGWSRSQSNGVVARIQNENPDILSLLSNPFYLKLAAAYIGASNDIPKSFAALYTHLVEHTWKSNEDTLSDNIISDFNEFIKGLSWVGYCMTLKAGVGTSIDMPSLTQVASDAGIELPSYAHIQSILTVAKKLKLLQIREFESQIISFQHHKLQEYFTAMFLLGKETSLASLLPKTGILGGIWWQETMVLLAALSNQPEKIIDYLFGIDTNQAILLSEQIPLDPGSYIQVLEGEKVELLARCYEVAKHRLDPGILLRLLTEISGLMPVSDPIRRVSYVRGLGRIRHPQAEQILRARIKDQSSWVREEAFFSLLQSKSSRNLSRRFLYKYLLETLWFGGGYQKGLSIAKSLFKKKQMPDGVILGFLTYLFSILVGFFTAIVTITGFLLLCGLKIPIVIAFIAALPFSYASVVNGKLFRVIGLGNQLRNIIILAIYFLFIYFAYFQFKSIWIIPVGLLVTQTLLLIIIFIARGPKGINDIFEQLQFQLVSHGQLHDELNILANRIQAEDFVLSTKALDALTDLYTRGCMHIHERAVEILRESQVDLTTYKRLRTWASSISYDDGYYDDIWRIVHEKEQQLRRQVPEDQHRQASVVQQLVNSRLPTPKVMTFEDVIASFKGEPLEISELVMVAERFAAVGNFQQAIAAIQVAIKLGPGDWSLIHKLGNWLVESGHFSDALAVFQQGLEKFPGNAPLTFGVAASLGWLERYEEAFIWAEKTCELSPSDANSRNYRNYLANRKPFGVVAIRMLSEPDTGKVLKVCRDRFEFTTPALTPSGIRNVVVAKLYFSNTHFVLQPIGVFEIKLIGEALQAPAQINLGDKFTIGSTSFEFIHLDETQPAVQ